MSDIEATSIAGVWVPQATGFASLAVAARSWPLTDQGRTAVAATRAARDATCVPYGPPALMAVPAEATVEDAQYFAAPITHRSQWDYRPRLQPANLPSDPEAARRYTTAE